MHSNNKILRQQLFSQNNALNINRPVLEEEQIWSRNETMKNWGTYKVYKFMKGSPTYFLPSIQRITLTIVILLAFILRLIDELYYNISNPYLWLSLGTTIIPIVALYIFCKTDPGIASSSLPLLNEQIHRIRKNFCPECKIDQQVDYSQPITHCSQSNVCIKSYKMYSTVWKCCVSKYNVKEYIFLNLSLCVMALTVGFFI